MAYPGLVDSSSSQWVGVNTARSIDYCQNGVWWAATHDNGSAARFYYSTDQGQTWNYVSGMDIGPNPCSVHFFIDKDDYMHCALASHSYFGYGPTVFYRRGTPNAARTSYTWSGTTNMAVWGNGSLSSDNRDYDPCVDIVAFRDPASSGWFAFIILTYWDGYYRNLLQRLDITSGGTITYATNYGAGMAYLNQPQPSSLDFRHTADDPKLVQAGTPSIYLAFILADGSNPFYVKFTYSGGSWSTSSIVYPDSTGNIYKVPSLHYDGTRVVVSYVISTDTATPHIYERDEANTTTTLRTPTALSDGYCNMWSSGYDANGDIWLVASGDTSSDLKKCQYNRAANTWGSWSTIYTGDVEDYYGANCARRTGPLEAGGILPVIFEENTNDFIYTTLVTTDPSGGGFGMPIR